MQIKEAKARIGCFSKAEKIEESELNIYNFVNLVRNEAFVLL